MARGSNEELWMAGVARFPGRPADDTPIHKGHASGHHPLADTLRSPRGDGVGVQIETGEAVAEDCLCHVLGGMGWTDADEDRADVA